MILKEYLQQLSPSTLIAIGSSSAYIFIGQVRDFTEETCKNMASFRAQKIPLRYDQVVGRNIRRVYRQKDVDYVLVILIEGHESGKYWLYSECLRDMENSREHYRL